MFSKSKIHRYLDIFSFRKEKTSIIFFISNLIVLYFNRYLSRIERSEANKAHKSFFFFLQNYNLQQKDIYLVQIGK